MVVDVVNAHMLLGNNWVRSYQLLTKLINSHQFNLSPWIHVCEHMKPIQWHKKCSTWRSATLLFILLIIHFTTSMFSLVHYLTGFIFCKCNVDKMLFTSRWRYKIYDCNKAEHMNNDWDRLWYTQEQFRQLLCHLQTIHAHSHLFKTTTTLTSPVCVCVNLCDKHKLHTHKKLPDPWQVRTVAVFTYSSLSLSLFRPQLVFSTPDPTLRIDSSCGQKVREKPSV